MDRWVHLENTRFLLTLHTRRDVLAAVASSLQQMTAAVINSVFDQIKQSHSVSDEQLSILHFLFEKNFERATKIVDQGGVRKISGSPSGRYLFLVVGESRRKEEYICFPDHHCTCYSFFYDVVSRGEQLCCKHQLASRLSEAVGTHSDVTMKLVEPIILFRHLLKNNSAKKGRRLLGLDVGNKYVGLAVSDSKNKIASPLSVLVRNKSNIKLMADDFNTLVSKLSLCGLIIGLPYNFHTSTNNEQEVRVRCFVDDLCQTEKLGDLGYAYWDENFTSKCVDALLSPLNLHPVEYKTISDKFAAVGILQGYLDCMNREVRNESDGHMRD